MATVNLSSYNISPNDSTVDDTSEVRQACIDAGAGGTVNLDYSGTVHISSTDRTSGVGCLEFLDDAGNKEPPGITFIGNGPETTFLAYHSSQDRNSHLMRYRQDNNPDQSGSIEEVTLDGNWANLTTQGEQDGVTFEDAGDQNFTYSNVRVRDMGGWGVRHNSGNCLITRCSFNYNGRNNVNKSSNKHGLNADSGGDTNPIEIEWCYFNGETPGGTKVQFHPFDIRGGEVIARDCYAELHDHGIKCDGTNTIGDMKRIRIKDGNNRGIHSPENTGDVGTVKLNDIHVSGYTEEGIALGKGDGDQDGDVSGDNILVENCNTANNDQSVVSVLDSTLSITTLACLNGNGDAVRFDGSTGVSNGTVDELQHEGLAGVGDTGNVTISNTVTTVSVSPSTPAKSETGINSASAVALNPMAVARGGAKLIRGGASGYQ